MKEMKDSGISWIGVIPTDWDVYPIKYNFNFISGGTPDSSNSDFWDGDIIWITPADYKTKDIYVSKGTRNITLLGYNSCNTHLLPKGTIVVSKRAPIGSVAIASTPLCTNQGCLGLVVTNDSCEKYYYYALSIYDDVLNLFGSGTTFKEISASVLGKIKVANPPVPIQKRIADYLDYKCAEIDSLFVDILSEISTLEEFKRSVTTEAVTRGLDDTVQLVESNIPWIGKMPNSWKLSKIKYEIIPLERALTSEDGIVTCFRDGKVTLRSNRREDGFTVSLTENGYHGVKAGDLVIHGMDAFAGAIGCSDSDGKISPVVHVCKTTGNNRYFMYRLRAMAYGDILMDLSDGIRVRSSDYRNFSKLGKFSIGVPPIDEQDEIVNYLDSLIPQIDNLIDEKNNQLHQLTEYKKAIIYEYVTGKKEVPANG